MAATEPRSGQNVVVDFGAHLHPQGIDLPDSPVLKGGLLGPHHRDPEAAAQWYSDAGVDIAVLSQPYYMGHDDLDEAQTANDALGDVIRKYDQFRGLAAIPVAAGPKQAAAEFERCLENGYSGGALETESGGIEFSDPRVAPVLEVANRRRAPLLVHPTLRDSIRSEVLDETYKLNSIFGREVALMQSICKVIHRGILDEYENLNLVYHHLGGGIAGKLGIIHNKLDPGRWPGMDHVKPFDEFKSQLEERIYLDTSGYFGYHEPIRTALCELPSSQLLFGTDAPFDPRSPEEIAAWRQTIEECASRTDAARILSKNAFTLLGEVD